MYICSYHDREPGRPYLIRSRGAGSTQSVSDIEISRPQTSLKVNISWQGIEWIKLELYALQQREVRSVQGNNSESEGIIVHKYIPTTGKSGSKPDADYDVLFLDNPAASTIQSVAEVSGPESVQLAITNPGRAKLPTLYPVAEGLSQIPVLEILEGTVIDYQGIWDLSQMERLN